MKHFAIANKACRDGLSNNLSGTDRNLYKLQIGGDYTAPRLIVSSLVAAKEINVVDDLTLELEKPENREVFQKVSAEVRDFIG